MTQGFLLMAIDWVNIRTFLLGMTTGIVLLMVSVATILVSDRKNKTKIKKSLQTELDDVAVQQLVDQKQKELTDTVKITENAYFRVATDLSFDLIQEIAKHYFPDSKYPIYELSLQELLNLNLYITERMNKLLNRKFIRMFKNSRISTIVKIMNTKKAIDNSKLMKLSKKLKVNKLLDATYVVLNYANPIYWFRKLAVKPSTNILTRELCMLIIQIVGEETNKLYSKKLFETPEEVKQVTEVMDRLTEQAESDELEDIIEPVVEGSAKKS